MKIHKYIELGIMDFGEKFKYKLICIQILDHLKSLKISRKRGKK